MGMSHGDLSNRAVQAWHEEQLIGIPWKDVQRFKRLLRDTLEIPEKEPLSIEILDREMYAKRLFVVVDDLWIAEGALADDPPLFYLVEDMGPDTPLKMQGFSDLAELGYLLVNQNPHNIHTKIYENYVLPTLPPQYPWHCAHCSVRGVDRGASVER